MTRAIVVLPTYNEAENLPLIVPEILGQDESLEVLVVDDASPDGTGGIADDIAAQEPRVHVLHRARKEGLGPAYRAGLQQALELGADYVIQMDADGQHGAAEIPRLLAVLETTDCDLVLGSRFLDETGYRMGFAKSVGREFFRLTARLSGLSITDIQAKCPTPERTVTGHPFNPPYLMPLVEIVGGEKSDADAVAWTGAFFKQAGKAPLVMDREVPGFVATRLQEAIWREALHMVNEGEATVEQIDIAVTNGPGPRWALMGPNLTFHLAGGEGGGGGWLDP